MTREILDALFAQVHVLYVEPVPDFALMNYACVCSCGRFETGQYVHRADAEARCQQPCEIELTEMASARRKAARVAQQQRAAA